MGDSEQYSAGEAWEMRFVTPELATGTTPSHPTSGLGKIASAILDAFELVGYEGLIFAFS